MQKDIEAHPRVRGDNHPHPKLTATDRPAHPREGGDRRKTIRGI